MFYFENLDFESFGLYFEIREKGTLYSAVVLSLLGMWLFKNFYVVFLSGWDTEPNSIFHRKKTVQKMACKPNINLVIADLIYWWSDSFLSSQVLKVNA